MGKRGGGRCLTHGSAYDLPVVFRVCQLLFSLEKNSAAVARLRGPLLQQVPSFKLVPLVYQLASRLSARPPPDHPGAAFQVPLLLLKFCFNPMNSSSSCCVFP